MDDQDLSGDDLKYVSYAIVFTKRDYEATLEENKQELVNYSTNGGSYGGLKLTKFFKRFNGKGNERPQVWTDADYPPAKHLQDEWHWEIPTEDEKYIMFIYRVEKRIPRQDADYDKRTAEALKGISGKIG